MDAAAAPADGFERLERLTEEAVAETPSPRQRAAITASGELLSTGLGVAYLSAQGLPAQLLGARELVRAKHTPHVPPRR